MKFNNVESLQIKIDAYFDECDPHMVEVTEWVQARDSKGSLLKDKAGLNYLVKVTHKVMTDRIPYTITGLAVALDTSRETLRDYEKGKYDNGELIEGYDPAFSDTIKKAKARCESFAEQMLFGPSPAGTIFNLKNNYGWKDRTEQDLTTGGEKINPMTALTAEELRKLAGK